MDKRKDKNNIRIILNPKDFIIPSNTTFNITAFVLAKNKKDSDMTFSNNDAGENLSMMNDVMQLSMVARTSSSNSDAVAAKPQADVQLKKKHAWQTLLHKFDREIATSDSQQEEVQRLEDEKMRRNYFVDPEPISLDKAICNRPVVEEVPSISGHIIIIGRNISNLYDLIKQLRAKYLGELKYIVILYPNEFPEQVWQRICIFEALLIVRGSPLG